MMGFVLRTRNIECLKVLASRNTSLLTIVTSSLEDVLRGLTKYVLNFLHRSGLTKYFFAFLSSLPLQATALASRRSIFNSAYK